MADTCLGLRRLCIKFLIKNLKIAETDLTFLEALGKSLDVSWALNILQD